MELRLTVQLLATHIVELEESTLIHTKMSFDSFWISIFVATQGLTDPGHEYFRYVESTNVAIGTRAKELIKLSFLP